MANKSIGVTPRKAKPQVYNRPCFLETCPFAASQDFFWRNISEWLRAHSKWGEQATGDNTPEELANFRNMQAAIPEQFHGDVRATLQSAEQAYHIVWNKGWGVDTQTMPRGTTNNGDSQFAQRETAQALQFMKLGFPLWHDRISGAFERAIKENNVEFFRRVVPEILNGRRKAPIPDPDKPETLEQWIVALWCQGEVWPQWLDSKLPPLCIFTDQAAADFLTHAKIVPGGVSIDAVRKIRQTLKLPQFSKPFRIKQLSLSGNTVILR